MKSFQQENALIFHFDEEINIVLTERHFFVRKRKNFITDYRYVDFYFIIYR